MVAFSQVRISDLSDQASARHRDRAAEPSNGISETTAYSFRSCRDVEIEMRCRGSDKLIYKSDEVDL